LGMIEPSLKALIVEDYEPDEETRIPLSVSPETVTDTDMSNDVILSGDGAITIEPL
jgi:hypothetical protein